MMFNSIHLPFWPLEAYDKDWHHLKLGKWGERAVARRLWLEGFRILAHRWESENRSDIDLVAARQNLLLFCEVKLRTSEDDAIWLKVVEEKRLENLKNAASAYLRESRQTRANIQFNAYLVRPDASAPRDPRIEANCGYLNPAVIPGWRGIADGEVFHHLWSKA
ncbi:YraN family protein [Candidatus Sumerlaeota bacterium]|nr:YraN family protein [Candidatus Sumerlaeota bacterium]